MENEVKQRNRRRKRAQRMQAQRDSKTKDGDSGEDESPVREKPQRPPCRRKKTKEPLAEEDIIDGFAILGFKSYEDLEKVLNLAGKEGRRLADRPRIEVRPHITHHGITLSHDPGTSDDSGRASERLTGSSVAPRDADSSRDRLSDASSRCSSGKGYICDSEGEDDKGSDGGSVIFAATPTPRKLEFPPASLPTSIPLLNNGAASPVPAPTPPVGLAAQSPALPPSSPPRPSPPPPQPPHPQPQQPLPPTAAAAPAPTPASVPVTMPQPTVAPAPVAHLPPALESTPDLHHGRTDSPAVATTANVPVAPGSGQYPPTFPPLYAPYAVHSPYSTPSPAAHTITATATTLPPTTTVATTISAPVVTVSASNHNRDSIVATTKAPSPRGHSPTRERDSYSSNVSSMSRGSVTPFSSAPPPPTTTVSSSLAFSKASVWPSHPPGGPQQLSPAPSAVPPRPTPPPLTNPLHSFNAPMFAAPLPPAVSTASSLSLPANPNPFSAESLFQSNQADMLRRELDSRFLASQDRSLNVGPPPYLRTEMHQHQHHHTHVHQHTASLLPPPPTSTLFPSPLVSNPSLKSCYSQPSQYKQFKDIPKIGSVDSPFYRQTAAGIPGYPGYSPASLLHPGLTSGPTPFVPPNHLPAFQAKQPLAEASKPKTVKSGKWNAMHVRVAWEIYHHQQKQQSDAKAGVGVKSELLRPPTHLFAGGLVPPPPPRPHDLPFPPSLAHRPPVAFEPQQISGSQFSSPASHMAGSGMSPFSRYGATAFGAAANSPFGMSPFQASRELPPLGPMHDPWSRVQRSFPYPAPSMPAPWSLKPDPVAIERREQEEREQRERERERERLRREREERERREREEKQRKQLEQQQQQQQQERERREKERRELERRELERERERERERLLHQQRLAESNKQASLVRDRSPLRNGTCDLDIRVKEEPRPKEEDPLSRQPDPRYHPYLGRHPATLPPPSVLDRTRASMLPPGLPPHFAPPPSHWPPPDPFAYRAYEPLRYNPLVEAMRAEEERVKLFNAYGGHPGQLRGKEQPPSLLHMRPGPGPIPPPPHKLCATPPGAELLKKDDSSQSR